MEEEYKLPSKTEMAAELYILVDLIDRCKQRISENELICEGAEMHLCSYKDHEDSHQWHLVKHFLQNAVEELRHAEEYMSQAERKLRDQPEP